MSLYELFTGRRPDTPLAAGNTSMTAATLTRWDRFHRALLGMAVLCFLPMISFAAGDGNPDLDFGIKEGDASKIVTSLYTIWQIVANSAVYIGAIVAVAALVFGLGARWVYVAVAVALIGGFGEWAVHWILQIGGMELVEKT